MAIADFTPFRQWLWQKIFLPQLDRSEWPWPIRRWLFKMLSASVEIEKTGLWLRNTNPGFIEFCTNTLPTPLVKRTKYKTPVTSTAEVPVAELRRRSHVWRRKPNPEQWSLVRLWGFPKQSPNILQQQLWTSTYIHQYERGGGKNDHFGSGAMEPVCCLWTWFYFWCSTGEWDGQRNSLNLQLPIPPSHKTSPNKKAWMRNQSFSSSPAKTLDLAGYWKSDRLPAPRHSHLERLSPELISLLT